MSRTTRKILLVPVLAAALLGAGCSTAVPGTAAPTGSDPAGSGGSAPVATDDPVVWVDKVCGALIPFADAAGEQPPSDATGDPADFVEGISGYLGKTSDAAGSAIDGLEAAGPAPVEQGDEFVKRLTETLTTIQTTFAGVKTDLDKIDTSDPTALATALPEAVGPLAQLSDLQDPTEGLRSSAELNAAAEQAPNCQQIEKTTQGG